MSILSESSGGDKTIEEQLQLRRVFRRLAFEFPLQRIDEKLQKLTERICSKHIPENTDGHAKPTKSTSEYENVHAEYALERAKFMTTLQDEANSGKDAVTSRYHIDAVTLQDVYDRLGCALLHGRQQAEELIWEINDSLDGKISYDEFERSYVRARSDRTGLEPCEIFFLTCFLMFDKTCSGKIALDDALKIFYLKYGDLMEDEMELHFGKQLDEGAQTISFHEYRDSILRRTAQLVDEHAAQVKSAKFFKRT